MRKTFMNTLMERARQDERICLVVGDLGFSVVEPFAQEFPERFLNAGVAEQNMTGLAAGWSLGLGKIVFTYSIGNFPTLRCLEQIRNDVCHHLADVKIVSVGGGLTYGVAGFTHHTIEDLAVLRAMPHMAVNFPADAAEARAVTARAMDTPGPAYIRLGSNNEPLVHATPPVLEPGAPLWYTEPGEVVLVSAGTIASESLTACRLLRERGVQASVLGLPLLKPLDLDKLGALLGQARAVISVEEHTRFGGLGSIVAEALVRNRTIPPFLALALPEEINQVGSKAELSAQMGLDAQSLVRRITEFMQKA